MTTNQQDFIRKPISDLAVREAVTPAIDAAVAALPFKVGDGATACYGSGRRVCTVIEASAKKVTVQWDIAIRTDAVVTVRVENQSYEYHRNPNGGTRQFSLRKNGRWVEVGSDQHNGTSLIKGRHEMAFKEHHETDQDW
jgi:hypothetical protein